MSEPVRDLLVFIGIIIAIFVLWAVNGGKQRATEKIVNATATNNKGEVVRNTNTGGSNTGTGGTSGSVAITVPEYSYAHVNKKDVPNPSPYFNKITLNYGSISTTNPLNEYLIVQTTANAKESINITGWKLLSLATGAITSIPAGTPLPYLNQSNSQEPVYLRPNGGRAYVISGRSPIGLSFQQNKCTGYFGSRTFNPSIQMNCPRIGKEPFPPKPNNFNDACLDYLSYYPVCQTATIPPQNLTHECQEFVIKEANYGQCVERHKNDSDFYSKKWHIYLNRNQSLWKSQRETIELRDAQDRVVDRISY